MLRATFYTLAPRTMDHHGGVVVLIVVVCKNVLKKNTWVKISLLCWLPCLAGRVAVSLETVSIFDLLVRHESDGPAIA